MAHLQGFGLENFRVFKEYTWFDFAPITILVGPNSSGKSSLIKALLLMDDNCNNARGPLSTELEFRGNTHKLGGPKMVLSNKSNKNNFSYVVPIYTSFDSPYSQTISIRSLFNSPIEFTKPIYRKFDFPVSDKIAVNNYQENLVLADLTPLYTRKDFGKVYLNLPLLVCLVSRTSGDNDYGKEKILGAVYTLTKFLREIGVFLSTDYEGDSEKFTEVNLWDKYCVEEFPKIFPSTEEEEYDDYPYLRMGQVEYEGKKYQLPNHWRHIFNERQCIKAYIQTLFPYYEQTEEVSEAICFLLRYGIAKEVDSNTGNLERGYNIDWPELRYLSSLKGEQKRSFRVDDNNSLSSLINDMELNPSIMEIHSEFLTEWTQRFNLGEIKIKSINELSINYAEVGGLSLADVGYGYTQLVTLLMTIIADDKFKSNPLEAKINDSLQEIHLHSSKTILLEEPEANLHPKFQSQLADLINAGREFVNQFIIETHSEYMIRKFQYLVAKGQLKPEDVVIYYFNDPNNIPAGEKQVKKINILEEGSLSDDFGPGFYDEAATWELELLKLKRNKNRQN